MKKYTIEDFAKFERVNGRIICPTGDYTNIKEFPSWCCLGAYSLFGDGCRFGERCSFGEWCSFGEGCSFDEWCSFGKDCSFGEGCSFGEWCRFGERCSFVEGCRFGERCSFGELCIFGSGCSYENTRVKNGKYFACDRIGSEKRKTYFFMDETEKMFVRAGCFFGTMDEFIDRVKKVHKGTKYEKEYLMACELAKVVLEVKNETI